MHPAQAKDHLRASIKDRLARMTDDELRAESRSVCRRILEHLPKTPIVLCGYIPLTDEVHIRPLLQTLIEQKYKVYLPCHEGNAMTFRQVTDLATLLPGKYGIPEPPVPAPVLDPLTLQLVLVPGRAFTADGKRLGRGNGGYDIWIKKQRSVNPKTQFWGIALEAQMVQEMPWEAHDAAMDAVATARAFLRRNN